MTNQKVGGASILNKMRILLKTDIQSLKKMSASQHNSSSLKDLLVSLVHIKQELLGELPENKMGTARSPQTPEISYPNNLNMDLIEQQKELKIINIIHDIEASQLNYLRKSIRSDGIPSGIKELLDHMMTVYQQTTEQLQRMTKNISIGKIVTF